jgi:hypothetical protein
VCSQIPDSFAKFDPCPSLLTIQVKCTLPAFCVKPLTYCLPVSYILTLHETGRIFLSDLIVLVLVELICMCMIKLI